MKKIYLTLMLASTLMLSVLADEQQDAMAFFNNYVTSANSYNPAITTMYSPTAKIIRQVIKPDGTTADAITNTSTYINQMKLGQAGAKLKKYKNNYSNVSISKISDGKYKISSLRQPSGETYKLKTYMIVQKQPSGKWLIVEEMMQTKMQIFLQYAK